ncbi:MAG: glycine zipper 2TM domain-containing protein [Rhodobacteraceae bacterium]|nr:glycine zipper 2TM domain-containing protein [Paracoccaceae bacterium]
MRVSVISASAALMFLLAACDDKVVENTAIGGVLGAVAGEAVWDKPVEGALVGGAVGAATAIE